MDIHSPRVLRDFLEEHGASARKRLSQNFLIDGNVVEKIVSLADLSPSHSCVIEIGPGPGALTKRLREQSLHLTTVELDPIFASQIKRFHPNIALEKDILQVDISSLIEQILREAKDLQSEDKDSFSPITLHIVSNLPYHLSTDILQRLLPLYSQVKSLTLMLQDEFAQRLLEAKPGSKEYGPLSLARELLCHCKDSFIVKPGSFYPRPLVRSRVIHLELTSPLSLKDEEVSSFLQFCTNLMQHRRKMMRKPLKFYLEEVNMPSSEQDTVIAEYGTVRAEQLCLNQWIELFQKIHAY